MATARGEVGWSYAHMLPSEVACLRAAESQHGLIGMGQVLEKGLTQDQVDFRVSTGAWKRVRPCVYAIGGFPTTWHQRVMAATLWSHGLASHRTAGALWGLAGCEEVPVEVITERKLLDRDVVVHRRASLPEWTSRISGIPVTDPTETVLDLAAVAQLRKLEIATDSALRLKLTHLDFLSSRLEERARQGRNGIRIMRAVIAARDATYALTQSELESIFLRLAKRYKLPRPVPQYVINDENGVFLARPDFVYPEARLAIELQSYAHHSGRQEWEKDQARFGDFAALGWALITVTYLQMKLEPARVAERVKRVLWSRSRTQYG